MKNKNAGKSGEKKIKKKKKKGNSQISLIKSTCARM